MPDQSEVSLTFGSTAGIEDLAEKVGQALGVSFELRDSMYLGGDYYRSRSDRGEVTVQQNDDLGEPAEPSHPELPTLVRVDTASRFEAAINEALQPLDLLLIDRVTRPRG
jgi:hypothetical protein